MAKNNFLKFLSSEYVINILGILIVLLFVVNLFFLNSFGSSLKNKIVKAEEDGRPAMLELIIIEADCEGCFDINKVVESIESGNVNITKKEILNQKTSFPLVWPLIDQYKITKLPTVIVKGELDKSGLNKTLVISDGALVFNQQSPPYYDVTSRSIKGYVSATIIDAENCPNCTKVEPLLYELKKSGVNIKNIINLNEKNSKDLIQRYSIKTLPTLILSNDALEYAAIKQSWQSIGTIEKDGNLITRDLPAPYKNLETGKIDGLVGVTYLIDSSCKTCYDVQAHKRIINGYGLVVSGEKTLDVSTPEGLAFAQNYNVTLVPTVVLSNDAKIYSSFYRVFMQVGEESKDSLVFKSVELMGIYKDLTTGKVVEPKAQGQ